MTALFSQPGVAALRRMAARHSALVFDLDGTLAPLVGRPADAQVPAATAARLRALSRVWPVAVLTGRSVADAVGRLAFNPHSVFGNHGAERRGRAATNRSHALQLSLDPVRARLRHQAAQLHTLGIDVEDKMLSLALHYRRSHQPAAARQSLIDLSLGCGDGVHANDGHCVLNITAAQAPDKGDAVGELVLDWSLDCLLVIGDDSNDEPAFSKAPTGSVSVRIAPNGIPTAAAFRLDRQAQINPLLDLLLALRPATQPVAYLKPSRWAADLASCDHTSSRRSSST